MNLLDVRKIFIQRTGRWDLVADDYINQGADFYIQAGQKMLDRMTSIPSNNATIYKSLGIGEYAISWAYSTRAIHNVFVNNDTTRYLLEKIELTELKEKYASSSPSNGGLLYYAMANLTTLESTVKDSLGTFINNNFAADSTDRNYRGMIIVPPADESYVVEINGIFHQFKLTDDTDENYWTLESPELLIKASMYQLNTLTRGAADYKKLYETIKVEALQLDKDALEEEIVNIDQMEG